MAKQKQKQIILKECKDCRYGFEAQGVLYCEGRLQDKTVLKPSGIVTRQDCIWFKSGEQK